MGIPYVEAQLDRLRILISEPDVARSQELILLLTTAGHSVAGVADIGEISVALDEKTPDVLLLSLDGNTDDSELLALYVKKLVEEFAVPVVVVVKGLAQDLSEKLAEYGVWGILPAPLCRENLDSALWIAAFRCWEYWEAANEIEKVKRDIETRESASKAKAIIMKHFSMGEHDAYMHLRSKCRNQQKNMEDVSVAIIAAEETLMKQLNG